MKKEEFAAALSRKNVLLPDGTEMPQYGMGTWKLAEGRVPIKQEENALRCGLDNGIRLIDTAEMYGEGASESLIGRVVKPSERAGLFMVSKVYPHNAGGNRLRKSCEDSLRRLKTDYLDLYLLHWRGSIPLGETVEGMEDLVRRGLIARWGVSNLDTADMKELFREGGEHCAVNQVLYHLGSRGIEYDLLPWMREKHMPVMAYCPLAMGGRLERGLLGNRQVASLAKKYGVKELAILLAFLMKQKDVVVIPKTASVSHLEQNLEATGILLSDEDWKLLSDEFPAPTHKTFLDMQ